MRSKILIVLSLFLVLQSNVYCKENTQEGNLVGREFRNVRMEISLKVCEAFSYNNDNVKSKIRNADRTFSTIDLTNDSVNEEKAKKVKYVISTWPSIDGDHYIEAKDEVLKYLNGVGQRTKEKNGDTAWVGDFRNKINEVFNDINCYFECKNQGDFSNYLEKYINGLFKDLAQKAQDSLAAQSESKEEETVAQDSKKQEELKKTKCPKCGNIMEKCTCNKKKSSPALPIVVCVLVLGGGYFIYRKKKNASADNKKVIISDNTVEKGKKDKDLPQPPKAVDEKPKPQEPPQVTPPDVEPVTITKPDSEWVLVGASVKGNGHIQSNMPCQDNHKYESLGNGWGIAVVSDGAGSAEHSELGSKVVAERGVFHFKNLIEKEGWMENNVLPTDVEWLQKSYYTLKNIRNEVDLVAQKNNVELKSLSATCLVVIYSPIGLLAAHVGDGRMGYKSASGEWRAMMTPHKGDEANQTIFLVSDFWSIPNYVMSGVLVPESIVVREPVKAFALMSDGCENTSWKCTTLNPETGKYFDQNKPFEGFFNPLEETLFSFHKENVSEEERKDKWYKFIESGTNGFVKEQDDKTMIYGVNVNL